MKYSAVLMDQLPTGETTAAPPQPKALGRVPFELNGSLEPAALSTGYKAGLVTVTLGMILLVAAYLAIIVFAGFGVYYHLRHNTGIFDHSTGSVALGVYLFPAVAGTILTFFLVKPIFARKPELPPRYSLTPQSDPALFEFIARICTMVNAPLPARVDVDCQVNASASFRRGIWSMRGNDVVLTIGLPLVAGMTMQEFGGVLAHEFGHFAQGAGMRLTYIIRSISRWFARVVYERDQWDEHLTRIAHKVDIRLGIFLHLSRLAVWLSRRVLWVLMHAGNFMSCFMLRQMEFDADACETKFAGSDGFARTSETLQKLMAANQWASQKLTESWKSRRLPIDLPSFIAISTRDIPEELRHKIEATMVKKKTGLLDTHPCDSDRVKAAMRLKEAGVFHSTEPATNLFKDFAELSAAATRFHYEHNLELAITNHNLVSHETAEKETVSQSQGNQAYQEFLFGLKPKYQAFRIALPSPGGDSAPELIDTLRQAKTAMEQSKPDVLKALADYEQAENLYQLGLDAIRQDSQQATQKGLEALRATEPALAPFVQQAQTRLAVAFQLLRIPASAEKMVQATLLQSECAQLLVVLAHLNEAFGPLHELRQKFKAFVAALEAASKETRKNARAVQAQQRVDSLAPELKDLIRQIREHLEDVPYPFQHAREDITLADFARNDIPASHKLQAIYNDCTCHISRLLPLYQRVLSRLMFISLQVEKQVL